METNKMKKMLISWNPKPKLAQRYSVTYNDWVDCGDTGAINNPLKGVLWVKVIISDVETKRFLQSRGLGVVIKEEICQGHQ